MVQGTFDRPNLQKTLFLTFFLGMFFPGSGAFGYIDNPYNVTFQVIRTPMLPMDEELPGEDEGALRVNLRWYNVWSIQHNRFIIDGEEFQVAPTFRYQVSSNLQLGITIPAKAQGGGVLDGSIEQFHSSVGVTQGLRDRYSRNSMNVSYEPLGEYYLFLDRDLQAMYRRDLMLREYPRRSSDPPLSLGADSPFRQVEEVVPVANYDRYGVDNPTVFYMYTWNLSNPFIDTIVSGLAIQIPVLAPRDLFRSAGAAYSVYATAGKEFLARKLSVKLGVSYTRFEMLHYQILTLPGKQWVVRPSISYKLDDTWTLLGEYLYFSRPVSNYGELSKPGHQFAFGFQKDVDNYRVKVAAIENIINFGVTPDIGFHFSVETMHL